jgi:hypothetical protein
VLQHSQNTIFLASRAGRNEFMMTWYLYRHHDEVHTRMCEQSMIVVEGGRDTEGSCSRFRGVATVGADRTQLVVWERFERRDRGSYGLTGLRGLAPMMPTPILFIMSPPPVSSKKGAGAEPE